MDKVKIISVFLIGFLIS